MNILEWFLHQNSGKLLELFEVILPNRATFGGVWDPTESEDAGSETLVTQIFREDSDSAESAPAEPETL